MSRTERRGWRLCEDVRRQDLTRPQSRSDGWIEAWGPDHTCHPGCSVCGKDLNARDRRRARYRGKALLRRGEWE